MIKHEIHITVYESADDVGLEVVTPDTLRTVEVIGYMELAKKQYIESKHSNGPTIYRAPEATSD